MSWDMDRRRFMGPLPKLDDLTAELMEVDKAILLVEDDVEYAEILKEFLEGNNYSVTVAHDGVQGMRRIMEKDFDVIICDLLMPNLPGNMFYIGVERVKPQMAKRFIFITGHQNDPKLSDFIKKVRALTLFKPFQLHVMLETVAVVLKKARNGS